MSRHQALPQLVKFRIHALWSPATTTPTGRVSYHVEIDVTGASSITHPSYAEHGEHPVGVRGHAPRATTNEVNGGYSSGW